MTVRRLLIPFAVLAGIAVLAMWGWNEVPAGARVPTHWNFRGEVDGYSSKTVGLLFPLVAALVITLLILFLPQIDPRRRNVERSPQALAAMATATNAVFLVIEAVIVLEGSGRDIDTARIVFAAVAVLFVVIGNYLPKTRSNFFVGIRTPWTLSSELSWSRTHRLGGRLMVAAGVATLVAVAFSSTVGALVLTVTAIGAALVSTVYSYLVWRNDPARA